VKFSSLMYNVINNNIEVLIMRVYVKKKNKNSTIPVIVMMIIFLSFPVGVFITFLKSGGSFVDTLLSIGDLLPFVILVSVFGIFCLCVLIKWPKGYKVKLVDKKIETYKGRQITNMLFRTQKENEQEEDFVSDKYKCFTKGENDLIVGNDYILKIKEFGWVPKFVEEISYFNRNKKNDFTSKTSSKFDLSRFVFSICTLVISILIFIYFYEIYKTKDYIKTDAIITNNIEESSNYRYVEVKYGNYTNRYRVYSFFMKEVGSSTTIYYSKDNPVLIRNKFLLNSIIVGVIYMCVPLFGIILYKRKSSNINSKNDV